MSTETKSNTESKKIWRRKKFLKKVIKAAEALLKNNDINKEEGATRDPIFYNLL